MIHIRRARPQDANGMGLAHVAAWRSAYAGILPEAYLSNLSAVREAAFYQRGIAGRQNGHAAFVAVAAEEDMPPGSRTPPGGLVVGFVTGGRSRRPEMAEGEVETLYVMDDWREQGLGRRLMRAMAAHLHALHCRNAFVWVLADNPSRWFYERLGGRTVARGGVQVAGQEVQQQALLWDPVESLLSATAGTSSPS
jgi:ribosomal protein S18 acetylase RimI-like enzyme